MPTEVTSPDEAADEPSPLSASSAPGEPAVVVAPVRPGRRPRIPRTAPVVGRPGAFAPGAWRISPRDVQLPHALQHPPYRRWWSGQIVALMGLWMQNTAAQLVILSITSSAFLIGAINIVSAVPLLMLSLVGGVLADRVDRRRILMVTQTCLASLSLVWAALVITDRIAYWQILVIAAIAGTIASFDLPAGQALFGQIVRREDLPEAVALNSASINATRSVGPALAGLVIGILGTAAAFMFHSLALLAFVVVIWSLGRLLPPSAPAPKPVRGSGLSAMREGLGHIRRHDDLLGLVGTMAMLSFLAVPGLLVLLPLHMTRTLGGGDGWVPATTSMFGVGSLAAAIIMFRASRLEAAAGKRLRLAVFGVAGALAWLALSPSPWVAIPGVLLAGFSFEMVLIQVSTRVQQLAPDEMRGRVLSANGLAFNGVMPVATLTISAASTVFGLPVVLGACGLALALGSVALWKRYTWKAFAPAG